MPEAAVKKKVLTVGDGDLSLSLALSRAYGDHVNITASVLESDRQEFRTVFPEAPLDELESRGVSVLYGVDATQLHSSLGEVDNGETKTTKKTWDLVSFHHPHLGISNLEHLEESARAALHHRLLCHYLYSAKQVSKLVHVCLTGIQPKAWNLVEAANRQNLTLVKTLPDSKPFGNLWMEDDSSSCSEDKGTGQGSSLPQAAKAEPHFAAPRKYRNGKLGRHFLARYGYRHRRTEGVLFGGSSKDANVSESMHSVFAEKASLDPRSDGTHKATTPDTSTNNKEGKERFFVCPICNESFGMESNLLRHLKCPIRLPTISKAALASIVSNCDNENSRLGSTEQKLNTSKDTVPASDGNPLGEETALEQRYDEKLKSIFLTVPSTSDGKRLRWFLQHSRIQNFNKFTKRLAESTIQAGLVSVNGQVALDSSRILKDKDTVAIQETTNQQGDKNGNGKNANERIVHVVPTLTSQNHPAVEIVRRSPSTSSLVWLVALKPSGMRTKGNFPGTLESIVSEQEEKAYSCISSLEISCSGLCVLVQHTTNNGRDCTAPASCNSGRARISVLHTMTVLVHGRLVREKWVLSRTASLVMEAKWRQKKKNKKRKQHALETTHQQEKDYPEKVVPAKIEFQESFAITENNTGLSTLTVATCEPSSSSICHYFRQEGIPVVGDAFCKQEYSKLKRSIRNRIKNKLCMGCYRVDVTIAEGGNNSEAEETNTTTIEIPSPSKLSAAFWEKFLNDEGPKIIDS